MIVTLKPSFFQILVGGKDVGIYDRKHLRSHIGLVGQEPVLFDTAVAENISLGKLGATKEEIEKAAKDANAHDFVTSMPEGYSTNVGELFSNDCISNHMYTCSKCLSRELFVVYHSCHLH